MIDRFKEKLIAEKDFLLKWLEIVFKATPADDLVDANLNYCKIKEAILSDWNECEVSCVIISLDFYNENIYSDASSFKSRIYSIGFHFTWEGDWLELEIRIDSVDAEGHHSCPQDEEYLMCNVYHEKDEFTFFDEDATQKFLNIFYEHQKKYPNLELPDIRTDIYFNI